MENITVKLDKITIRYIAKTLSKMEKSHESHYRKIIIDQYNFMKLDIIRLVKKDTHG